MSGYGMRDEVYRGCLRKKRYEKKRDAPLKEGLRTYRCDNCGGWHLTSKPYKRTATS